MTGGEARKVKKKTAGTLELPRKSFFLASLQKPAFPVSECRFDV